MTLPQSLFDIEHFTASDWAAVLAGLLALLTAIANVLAGKAQSKTVEGITKTADSSIELAKVTSKEVAGSLKLITKALSNHLSDIGTKTAAMDVRTTSIEAKTTAMDGRTMAMDHRTTNVDARTMTMDHRTTNVDARTIAMDAKLDQIISKLN